MNNELKEAFEIIINCQIEDRNDKVYQHYFWASGFAWRILEYLKRADISEGTLRMEEGSDINVIYDKHIIDVNNSLIEMKEEYFSQFGEEIVDEINKETILIGDKAYLKGASLIDVVKKYNIDMSESEEFEYAIVVARIHTDGTLYNALDSLFCTSIEYDDIKNFNDHDKKLDNEWKAIFENIKEPFKSKLACFFVDNETAKFEGAICYNSINNKGLFSEFVKEEGNDCVIQLFFGESHGSTFILEVNDDSILAKLSR